MPTQWSGQAELDAASGLGGKARQTDTQPTATLRADLETATGLRLTDTQSTAKLSANGATSVVGYAATLFSALVNVLEQETDAASQRDAHFCSSLLQRRGKSREHSGPGITGAYLGTACEGRKSYAGLFARQIWSCWPAAR